ncbi:twin-arginine translocation signal domain-containing protein [Roseateles sp. P5_E7]
MAAVKPARPGLSAGFTAWPARSTRLALTSGRPGLGEWMTVRPLASVKLWAAGSDSALALAAPGGLLRQASSAFSASRSPLAVLVGAAGVATSGASTCSPGLASTTTRRSFLSHCAVAALTAAGVSWP